MKEKLKALLESSYSPYSKFQVAAISVMKDGKEFKGVNVENASYGATVCAERSSIFGAISNGYKKNDFESLHIMVSGNSISMPCFICRQVISELFEKNKIVTCYDKSGNTISHSVAELCPYPFDESDLS
jgi:cytidine deaminase